MLLVIQKYIKMKLASCKRALNHHPTLPPALPPPPPHPVVYSTDRSKAVVPVLVLLFVALWFILRGDLLYVFPCVILFLCFLVLLVLRLPRLGKRELILVLFVRLFDLCLFGFVGFLFLLGSGKGCGLWLWHSLDFSLTFLGGGRPVVVFLDDDVQLHPDLDTPYIKHPGSTPATMRGSLIWNEFTTVVDLRTLVRQGNEEQVFRGSFDFKRVQSDKRPSYMTLKFSMAKTSSTKRQGPPAENGFLWVVCISFTWRRSTTQHQATW